MSERPDDAPDEPTEELAAATEPELEPMAVDEPDVAAVEAEAEPKAAEVAEEAVVAEPEPAPAPEPEAEVEVEVADEDDESEDSAEDEADDQAADTDDEAAEADADTGVDAVAPDTRRMSPAERRAARSTSASHFTIDPALRIKDRASAIFVLITVGFFLAILLNGLVLGHGGFLTPLPTIALPPIVTPAP